MSKFRSSNEEYYQDGNYASQREYLKKNVKIAIPEVVFKISIDFDELNKVFEEVGEKILVDLLKKDWSENKIKYLSNPNLLKILLLNLSKVYNSDDMIFFKKTLSENKIFNIAQILNHPDYKKWKAFKEYKIPLNSPLRNDLNNFKFLSIMETLLIKIEKKYGED